MNPARAYDEITQLKEELGSAPRSTAGTLISYGFWQRLQVVVRRSLGAESPFVARIDRLTHEWASSPQTYSPGMAIETLDSILFELQLLRDDEAGTVLPTEPPDPEQVFVVHGRDLALRDSMFSFLRALGLSPIEWETAASWTGQAAPYVGTILDVAFGRVQAVVVMLTPDEVAHLRPELASEPDDAEATPGFQARPNVLFEAGMAMGRHPDRTILVSLGETRPFSDIGGRTVIKLADGPEGRNAIANRLRTAGCAVDTSGSDWLTKGTFTPSVTAR